MCFRHQVFGAAVVLASAPALAQAAEADSNFSVSIGLKAFVNRVSGPGYADTGVPGLSPVEAAVATTSTTSFLPSVSIRRGPWGVYGTYHARSTYSADVGAVRIDFPRKEWDASVGYSVFPNLVIAAGWKSLDLSNQLDPRFSQAIHGPFVGVSGGAALSDAWSFYGSMAIGRPQFELGGKKTGGGGEYLASEVGLGYALGQLSPSLKGVSALFGYRTQTFRFDDVPFAFLSSAPGGGIGLDQGKHRIRSGIEGLTFGVSFHF